MEIVELDRKLRDSHPGTKIPDAPIDPASILPPPKRKSNFLNTLSRLASPVSSKGNRNRSSSRQEGLQPLAIPSNLPTPPLTSPTSENNDPFTSIDPAEVATATPASPSATSTSIAAYLTTISNIAVFRKDRVWKRFVRVRTDDLQSVRVERAIKRVRSDLAAHVGGGGLGGNRASLSEDVEEKASQEPKETAGAESSLPSPEDDHKRKDGAQGRESEEGTEEEAHAQHNREATAKPANQARAEQGVNGDKEVAPEGIDGTTTEAQGQEDEALQTPVNEHPSSPAAIARNMPRSQSAEPDKSHRISRAYTVSVPSQDGASSTAETGDESSFSATTGSRRRKKKAKRAISSRKVTVDDFEMIRVLGKGCAGKVLLVRHKNTQGLFALKAITKRHVLAHQELQHTLTEQAVLKRMAAESKDPFVVKLWWSFHDKENLFLVMVRFHTCLLLLLQLTLPPDRTSTLEEILPRSSHDGADSVETAPVSTPQRSSKVLRGSMPLASFIEISNPRTFSSQAMGISF